MKGPAVHVARAIAAQAAVVLANAAALTRAELTNRHLEDALISRDLIGQAKGVLMARQDITAEEAFTILVHASQRAGAQAPRYRGRGRGRPRPPGGVVTVPRAAALEAARDMLGLSFPQLWTDYFALSGCLPPAAIGAFLAGNHDVSDHDHDLCGEIPSPSQYSGAQREASAEAHGT